MQQSLKIILRLLIFKTLLIRYAKIKVMKRHNFHYINAISKERIETLDGALKNRRLIKHLWIEFILNSEAVESAKKYLDTTTVEEAITDALSWYLAFRWLLPENTALEGLHKQGIIRPYRISNDIYRGKRRSFLKGILHAGLC